MGDDSRGAGALLEVTTTLMESQILVLLRSLAELTSEHVIHSRVLELIEKVEAPYPRIRAGYVYMSETQEPHPLLSDDMEYYWGDEGQVYHCDDYSLYCGDDDEWQVRRDQLDHWELLSDLDRTVHGEAPNQYVVFRWLDATLTSTPTGLVYDAE